MLCFISYTCQDWLVKAYFWLAGRSYPYLLVSGSFQKVPKPLDCQGFVCVKSSEPWIGLAWTTARARQEHPLIPVKEVLSQAAQTTKPPSLLCLWICWQGSICLSNFHSASVEMNHICQDLLLGLAQFAGTEVGMFKYGCPAFTWESSEIWQPPKLGWLFSPNCSSLPIEEV